MLIDALNDDPMTPTPLTISSPSVSAKAVAAVRRGLRTALVRAIRPIEPNGLPTTTPSGVMTQPASTGETSNAPTPTPTNPSEGQQRPVPPLLLSAPSTVNAAPTTRSAEPIVVRRFRLWPELEANSSRMAATGGTRPARRAGA